MRVSPDSAPTPIREISIVAKLIPVLLSLIVTVYVSAATVEQENVYFFEIPSQKVEDALNRVAQQTKHQLLFSLELVEPLKSPAVVGEYTVQQALNRLLEGSNLSGRVTGRGVIVIVSLDAKAPDSEPERAEMKTYNKSIFTALMGLLGAPSMVIGEPVEGNGMAQEQASKTWSGIEEVVVTAQKREDFSQSTPVALSAISGEALRTFGINNALDLNGISPSLSVTLGNGQVQMTMRGAGNEILSSGIGEAGVAFHSNGIYIGSSVTPLLGFFDVERLEIMRGPQGTLWGRNSTGGAINVIQKRPTEDLDAHVNVEFGNYDTLGFEGAAGGRLTDNVQGRIAVNHRKSDGYLENKAPGQQDLGDDDSLAVRGSLNITLGDNTRWLLAAGYGGWDIVGRAARQEGTAFPAGTLNPTSGTPGELTFSEIAFGPTTPRGEFETYATNPRVGDSVDMHYLTSELSMDFSSVNLTLISDIRKSSREFLVDPDFTLRNVEDSMTMLDEEIDEISQEIRLASSGSNALDWLVGYYYYQQELEVDAVITTGPFPGVPDTLFFGFFGPDLPQITLAAGGTLKSRTQGVFGQGTYRFNDSLAATVGLRYSWDEKHSAERADFLLGSLDGLSLLPRSGGFDESWKDWSGKLGLEYSPAKNIFLFANVAKGYKSGGINFGNLSGSFNPEELISYELGVKSDLWNNRMRGNITAYYSDYTGYQLQSIDGITAIITNADADITGVEMEIIVAPAESWLVNLVATWTNSEVTGFAQAGLTNPATGAELTTSQPLPRTPENTYRLGFERHFAVAESKTLSALLAYTWQGEVNLDAFDTHGADEDAYGLLDAVLRYGSDDDNWSVDLYGKNLTNEYYKTSVFLFGVSLGAAAQAQIGAPRTYGIRFHRRF